MNFKEWIFKNGLQKDLKPTEVRVSQKTYLDSDVKQRFYKLPRPVDSFEHITVSLNAVEALLEKQLKAQDLDVVFDAEYGWKAQLPCSCEFDTELELDEDW